MASSSFPGSLVYVSLEILGPLIQKHCRSVQDSAGVIIIMCARTWLGPPPSWHTCHDQKYCTSTVGILWNYCGCMHLRAGPVRDSWSGVNATPLNGWAIIMIGMYMHTSTLILHLELISSVQLAIINLCPSHFNFASKCLNLVSARSSYLVTDEPSLRGLCNHFLQWLGRVNVSVPIRVRTRVFGGLYVGLMANNYYSRSVDAAHPPCGIISVCPDQVVVSW